MTLNDVAQRALKAASDHSPLILTALGVAGTVTTAVLTGKAALKAYDLVGYENESRSRHNTRVGELALEPLTPREMLPIVWKQFIPPALSLVGTITCIVCANRIGTRRAAAMAAAYSLSEKAFVEYKDKVVEQIGKNKEQKVRDEIIQDRMVQEPASGQTIFSTGNGSDLCWEKFTGRYFYSSMEDIKHAQNQVNHKIVNGVYASLSDFYDYLGLSHTGVSDELGWNGDNLMEIMFTSAMSDDNKPCIAIDYRVEPVRNYFRIH